MFHVEQFDRPQGPMLRQRRRRTDALAIQPQSDAWGVGERESAPDGSGGVEEGVRGHGLGIWKAIGTQSGLNAKEQWEVALQCLNRDHGHTSAPAPARFFAPCQPTPAMTRPALGPPPTVCRITRAGIELRSDSIPSLIAR